MELSQDLENANRQRDDDSDNANQVPGQPYRPLVQMRVVVVHGPSDQRIHYIALRSISDG